jgi:hypothetical protein
VAGHQRSSVHQQFDGAQCGSDFGDPRFDILQVGDIATEGGDIVRLRCCVLQPLVVDVENCDFGALFRQAASRYLAHSAGAAGYDGNFARHIYHSHSTLLLNELVNELTANSLQGTGVAGKPANGHLN